MQEEWRPVVGFENFYEISSLGRLRGRDRIVEESSGKKRIHYGKILSLGRPNKHGYFIKTLYSDDNHRSCQIHRLVAEAFIPNPMGLEQVNHINGDKGDNNVGNLEWIDRQGNTMHAIYALGKKCGNLPKAVYCVEDNIVFRSLHDAARFYNTSASVINRAVLSERKLALGKHWKEVSFFSGYTDRYDIK